MNLPNTVAPGLCHDIPWLLQQFEGLGENCDFGVVQRASGIEPFGLLRFGACNAADLGELLRTRFERLGDEQDLLLEAVGAEREYWVKSRHCSFSRHTDRHAGRDDEGVVRASQLEKNRYLIAKLISHLTHSRRLFVFKGLAHIGTILEIVTQLQTYGPNCLLWICIADDKHLPGCVERLSDHLLRGFVTRYGTYDGEPSLPVDEWVAVCANAYRLWRKADPPTAPLHNLIATAMDERSCRWLPDPAAATRVLDEPAPAGGFALEHRLPRHGAQSVYRASLPIDSGGDFVFSAWIRLPEEFRGRLIYAYIPGAPRIAIWTADLKSGARWQRVWMAATVPIDARGIDCEIMADGAIGATFHSASWCLERGTQPLGYAIAP